MSLKDKLSHLIQNARNAKVHQIDDENTINDIAVTLNEVLEKEYSDLLKDADYRNNFLNLLNYLFILADKQKMMHDGYKNTPLIRDKNIFSKLRQLNELSNYQPIS